MKHPHLAALTAIFLAGCAGTNGRLERAAQTRGEIEATKALPDLPAYCLEHTRSGVRVGDRLDVALLKTDAALSEEHRRTFVCAEWYGALQRGFATKKPSGGA